MSDLHKTLKEAQKHLINYQALLSGMRNKHGDTDQKDIEKQLKSLDEHLPKLNEQVKLSKPSKALTEWNRGTHEAMKNYNPTGSGRPY